MYKNDLIRKVRLFSKCITLQSGKPTIAIYTMPNISRSKDSMTMKFGQLIENNMRKIFLEKSYTKWGGETIPTSCSQKLKLSITV